MGDRSFTNTIVGAITVAAIGGIAAGVVLYEYNEARRESNVMTGPREVRPAPATENPVTQPPRSEPEVFPSPVVTVSGDGSTTWRAGFDGVEVEWNRDGSVRRISSRYTAPVLSADSFAVRTALTIAEEQAKGAIVRFMQETVSSKRIVTQVESDLSTAAQQLDGSGSTGTRQRTLVTSLVEVTESYASGELRGVVVLESGYDQPRRAVWIVVGIDQKTLGAARAARDMMSRAPQ